MVGAVAEPPPASASVKVNLPFIMCPSVESTFQSTVYVPDSKSSSSICSFLSPSASVALFLSTRLPVWSVTATVLIEASSSSLNHNSTVFGACLRAALAFGSERSRRAWADATDAQRKKVSASVRHPASFHTEQTLFTNKGFILITRRASNRVRAASLNYCCGCPLGGFCVPPCISCMGFISILPGRMRKKSFQETGRWP